MPELFAAPVITVSRYDDDGRVTCQHRDLSVCKACFDRTPGLVDVYDVQYRFDIAIDAALLDNNSAEFVFVSPGTVTS